MILAARMMGLEGSLSVGFADLVRKLEGEGRSLLKLQTGDPEFATPAPVLRAAQEALQAGQTRYCDSTGLAPLRQAISRKLSARNGVTADPFTEILVTHGAVAGLFMSLQALLSPGDEVLILAPYWRAYASDTLIAGGVPVFVELSREDGFQPTLEKIKKAWSPKVKVVIVNSPNNPTGAVYSREFLTELVEWVSARDAYLISDEVYENYVYGSKKHFSPASLKPAQSNLISLFSLSKTYAMTGWRMGYVLAPPVFIQELLKISQYSVTSLAPYAQLAAVQALQDPESELAAQRNREICESNLRELRAAIRGSWLESRVIWPEGAFYLLMDFRDLGLSSQVLALRLLERCGLALTPGDAFGGSMDGFLRMCFAFPVAKMQEFSRRLASAKEALGL